MRTHPQLLGLAHAKHVFLVVGGGGARPPRVVTSFHAVDNAQGVFVRGPFAVRGSSWECHHGLAIRTSDNRISRSAPGLVLNLYPWWRPPVDPRPSRMKPIGGGLGRPRVRIGLASGGSYADRGPSTVSRHGIASLLPPPSWRLPSMQPTIGPGPVHPHPFLSSNERDALPRPFHLASLPHGRPLHAVTSPASHDPFPPYLPPSEEPVCLSIAGSARALSSCPTWVGSVCPPPGPHIFIIPGLYASRSC